MDNQQPDTADAATRRSIRRLRPWACSGTIESRIIKTISKGVVLIISPFLKKLYCRNSYLLYNQNKHCGFVSIELQLRLFGGDSDRSGLSELVISWETLDVLFA